MKTELIQSYKYILNHPINRQALIDFLIDTPFAYVAVVCLAYLVACLGFSKFLGVL